MKLNEFSKRIGIPLTKLRYYARIDVTNPVRQDNSYRDFSEQEALDIYNTLMLRSFDMSIEEIVKLHNGKIEIGIDNWIENQIDHLEDRIAKLQVHLTRLKELHGYFEQFHTMQNNAFIGKRYEEYILWSFDDEFVLNDENQELLKILTEKSPFSYIALKIPEDQWKNNTLFSPKIGIGILKRNLEKAKVIVPENAQYTEHKEVMGCYFEKENLFSMTQDDLLPFFQMADEMNIELYGDLTGRFYLSYTKQGKRVYCYALCLSYRKRLTCE